MAREATIMNNIRKALKERGCYVIKTHGSQFSIAGMPDLLVIRAGRIVFLEVKQPGEIATPRQLAEHEKIRKTMTRVEVVTSVSEALDAVNELI